MKIYCIRHGQTDWNVLGKIQGITDIELNEIGKNEAKRARAEVESLNLDLIICSPLIRAKQTAEILNDNLKLPIIIDERIIERNFGEYEGKYKDLFDFSSFWDLENRKSYEGAETMSELIARLREFFKDIREKYSDKNLLIVTHGATIRGINLIFNPNITLEQLTKMSTKNCQIRQYEL